MPRTLTQTCALCGLRYASSALLELHIREDHVQPGQQAEPGRGDAADNRISAAPAGTSGRNATASRLPRPLQTPTGRVAPTRSRRRLQGSGMAALRRVTRLARQSVRAVRDVNDELLRASDAISLRRVPEPRRPPQRPGSDTDPRLASEGTQPAKRAA
jgi:hypothetical protein